MDHQVEDDVDVETSRGEGTEPVHLDEARVRHERQGDADGWIITLGMADREGRARRRRGGDHLIRLRDGPGDGLFDEDGDATLKKRQDDAAVGLGRHGDRDGIDPAE